MSKDDTAIGPLRHFHPLISKWFRDRYHTPTEIQASAWHKIQSDQHVLVTAPTGSGKTLAAFLWAIDQLARGNEPVGHTRVLYVSPLKALNNDVRGNLLQPLDELRTCFQHAGEDMPEIRVLTRSGDTPYALRRQMLRQPPEILITTPESLNLLLASPQARTILRTVSTLILDEIHAVFASKRGTYLMTAVERLVLLAGEFQRIALSATVNPLEAVAAFVGGYRLEGDPASPKYVARSVSVLSSPWAKQYDVRVCYPQDSESNASRQSIWDWMVQTFKSKINKNRSTLVFVNNRRLCEKIALKLNQGEAEPQAYAHHGSLSREIRQSVEHHLKEGQLRAITATNSLELGIDIGPLDEVLLVQSPPSLSAAIQRIGRAGHQVGQVSRGSLYPSHARDILEAAVLAQHIPTQSIEPQESVQAPLDVLAQVIVAMTGVDVWDVDELFAQVKACYAYRDLPRRQFDLVLQMLAGKYALSRLRDLKPRVAVDGLTHTVKARKGALQAVYLSGGVIPDRGYFHLRHAKTGARIGELDEEFVWEAKVGQTFNLGAQKWRIEKITAAEVLVVPGHPLALNTPFWRGEAFRRDWYFSEKILDFMRDADRSLTDDDWQRQMQRSCHLEPAAATALLDYLIRQKTASKGKLPHRHHLVVERIHSAPGAAPGNQIVVLNLWGAKVNQPLALAMEAAWHGQFDQRLEIFAGNDAIALLLPHEVAAADLLALVNSHNLDQLLRQRLEASGLFGARFRECAARALLLSRPDFKKRMPLWMSRLRSQKLFAAVKTYEDFPMLLETWRTCLQDEFDLQMLRQLLAELENGVIAWSEVQSVQPSPMARQMAWNQINDYMYRDDTPRDGHASHLSSELLHEIVHSPALRPSVSRTTAEQFEVKSLRLTEGYAPSHGEDLVEWVKERLLVPASEWRSLWGFAHGLDPQGGDRLSAVMAAKLVRLRPPQAAEDLIVARDLLGPVVAALPSAADHIHAFDQQGPIPIAPRARSKGAPEDADLGRTDLVWLLGEWLQFYGPRTAGWIAGILGIELPRVAMVLDQLVDEGLMIHGPLVKDESATVYCDARNFEILLRMERRAAQPVIEPLPCEALAPFLATVQGLVSHADTEQPPVERLLAIAEQMTGYALAANLWEGEVLPARMPAYDPAWLDSLMQTSDLRWIGRSDHRLMFCFEPDLDLLVQKGGAPDAHKEEDKLSAPASSMDKVLASAGRYDFSTLLNLSGLTPAQASQQLWQGVWQGAYSNDSFAAMRQGIANRFKTPETDIASPGADRYHKRRTRSAFSRWKAALPQAGNWFKITYPQLDDDLLARQERHKDRVRLLLKRYGVLFRELLSRELPALRWASLFRTLRLMDLSGEIYSGCFFQGIAGLQFITPRVLSLLQQKLDRPPIFWLNATDPASVCGLGLEPLRDRLPRRIASNHMVYRGPQVVVLSMRHGRKLEFNLSPDDPDINACLGYLHHLLNRGAQSRRSITIETINDRPAVESPYLPAFMDAFEVVRDPTSITLYRRIG